MQVLVTASSCSQKPEKQIAKTTKAFAESFYNLKYDKALDLCTTHSAAIIIFYASNITDNHINMLKSYGKAEAEVLDINIGEYGTSAKVKCKITNCMKPDFIENTAYIENEIDETFYLVKSADNNWYIDLNK